MNPPPLNPHSPDLSEGSRMKMVNSRRGASANAEQRILRHAGLMTINTGVFCTKPIWTNPYFSAATHNAGVVMAVGVV